MRCNLLGLLVHLFIIRSFYAFNPLTLLVGRQAEHLAHKNECWYAAATGFIRALHISPECPSSYLL